MVNRSTKLTLSIAAAMSMTFSMAASAAGAWYVGAVKRVALAGSDGSFIVTLKNTALDDCKHSYAYFNGSQLGDARLKHAYSMALTSVASGLKMGIVIDKSLNGSGGRCNATGMVADIRAN